MNFKSLNLRQALVLCLLTTTITAAVEPPDVDTCHYMDMTIDTSQGFAGYFGEQVLGGDSDTIYEEFEYIFRQDMFPDSVTPIYGINDLSFNFPVDDSSVAVMNEIYGYETTTTNFTLAARGLFTPPETGEYTISSEDVTGGLAVGIIPVDWLYCCELIKGGYTEDEIDELAGSIRDDYFFNIPGDSNHTNSTYTTTLRAGVHYNLYFIYLNTEGTASMKITMTFPSGRVVTDFSGLVGQMVAFDCDTFHATSTAYSGWEDIFTTTYSTEVITHDMTTATTLETIYYVVTPTAVSSSEEPSITDYPSSSSSETLTTQESSSDEPSTNEESTLTEYTSSSSEEPSVTDVLSSSQDTDTSVVISSESPVVTGELSSTEVASSNEPDITETSTLIEPTNTSDVTSSEVPITTDVTSSDIPDITVATTDATSGETSTTSNIVTDEVTSTDGNSITSDSSTVTEIPGVTTSGEIEEPETTGDVSFSDDAVDKSRTSSGTQESHTTEENPSTSIDNGNIGTTTGLPITVSTSTITVTGDDGHVYTTITECTVTDAHTITDDCASDNCIQSPEGTTPTVISPVETAHTTLDAVSGTKTNIDVTRETTVAQGTANVEDSSVKPTTQHTAANTTNELSSATSETKPSSRVLSSNAANSAATKPAVDVQSNADTSSTIMQHVTTQLVPTASLYSPNDVNGGTRHAFDSLLAVVVMVPLLCLF